MKLLDRLEKVCHKIFNINSRCKFRMAHANRGCATLTHSPSKIEEATPIRGITCVTFCVRHRRRLKRVILLDGWCCCCQALTNQETLFICLCGRRGNNTKKNDANKKRTRRTVRRLRVMEERASSQPMTARLLMRWARCGPALVPCVAICPRVYPAFLQVIDGCHLRIPWFSSSIGAMTATLSGWKFVILSLIIHIQSNKNSYSNGLG